MILGTLLLGASFLAALAGAAACFWCIRGGRTWLQWARGLSSLVLVLTAVASLFLLTLILAQRYDVAYVYQYTSRDLALPYRISAFWAGQQGSFLFWQLLAALLTVLQIRRSRQFEPYVLFFMLLVQAGLLLFLLVDSPFQLLGRVPVDGFGLNPLLQNPWMVAHPPVLFLGYAGLTLPFAYALGGLWRRKYDDWVRLSLPWTLLGWLFLGLGICMGAYWAYETLGWGGYWGWDLVENSSLIPWLTGTALLHGLLIQRYRRRLYQGNFILAIATFLLILYATYLTRSGVLSEVSTHSFVETGLNPWMLGVLALMATLSVALLVYRWRDIPRGPVFADDSDKGRTSPAASAAGTVGTGPQTWLSRDFTFLITVILLLFLTAPILIGTLVPVVTRLWGLPDVLDISFYPRTTAPFLMLMMAVLIVCPLLGWRETSWSKLSRFLAVPAIVSILSVLGAFLWGARQPLSLLLVLLGSFALATNAAMVVRTVRRDFWHIGGYLAHVGLGLLVLGILASSVYSQQGLTLSLLEGQAQSALGYTFTFLGWQESPGAKPALRLQVEAEGGRFTALPELYRNPQDNSMMATPHVQRELSHDLYIAPEGYDPAQRNEPVAVAEGSTVNTAGYSLALQALQESDGQALLTVQVAAGAEISVLSSTFPLLDSAGPAHPAILPGGELLMVEDVYLPPPGLLLLFKDQPVYVAAYTVTMRGFYMDTHENAEGMVSAGVVLEFMGPQGLLVVSPTQSVGDVIESPPAALWPGSTVQLVQIAVEQQAAQVQIEGLDLPRQPGLAWLRVQGDSETGVAHIHVSLKPGMNLLWGGAGLLLLGAAIAMVRRWRQIN
ncbi:MAG: cytochrome c biogenesis protein CcsA [Chloroflexia bacterium]|nr:cytochrome c biogenesis protein CcsA [Chloroflexia bacterium]